MTNDCDSVKDEESQDTELSKELTEFMREHWVGFKEILVSNGKPFAFSYKNEHNDFQIDPIWRAPIIMKRKIDTYMQMRRNGGG